MPAGRACSSEEVEAGRVRIWVENVAERAL